VDAEKILTLVQLSTCAWMKHKIPNVNFSYSNWNQCPIECIKSTT